MPSEILARGESDLPPEHVRLCILHASRWHSCVSARFRHCAAWVVSKAMIWDDVAPRVKKEFIPPDLFIPISGTYSTCSMSAAFGTGKMGAISL